MQAELNKYFYDDITNIILDYHYKTMFNESIKAITDFIKGNTNILDSDESNDESDESNDESDESDDERYDKRNYEIVYFRSRWFDRYRSIMRKAKRQNTMNEEDTDSDLEELDNYKIFRIKEHHDYMRSRYSPEEFAYKIRYPDDESDCDW